MTARPQSQFLPSAILFALLSWLASVALVGQRKNSAAELEEAIKSYSAAMEGFQQVAATSDVQTAQRGVVVARALLDLLRKP